MATFVLVHGAWAGGWSEMPVARLLRAAGHEVFVPTLTGFGERVHLASPDVNLDTHIQDVVNLLFYEDLHDVVLVGSSQGGMVISGVAEQSPERIAKLVYMDAEVPRDGESAADIAGPDITAGFEATAKELGDGWRIPFGPDDTGRRAPNMLAVCKQPLRIQNPRAAEIPRVFVHHTGKTEEESWIRPMFERMAARVKQDPRWTYLERPFVHYPQLDQEGGPELVAELLLQLI